ncbi:MAG TPA: hypothetical protein VHW91_07035 [Candidatus Dormibacteraeota bacterium]|nr:hypothetical protein [Candidatus Dormibacteraeota bacterium]
MYRVIAPIIGLVVAAFVAPLPAFADTPGGAPACVSQSLNPHPAAPVGPTTDTVFCNPTPTPSAGATNPSGNGSSNGSNGSTAGTASNGRGSSTGTGIQGTSAGSTTGSSTIPASFSGTGNAGAGAANNAAATTRAAQPASSTPFLTGLTAFLGAAGGLAYPFFFLLLLAMVLLVIAVVARLRATGRDGWGPRFARVTHRP